MKKTLLTIFSAIACMSSFAQQTPSPQWTVTQNSNFPIPSAGIRYMDAADPNSVWATGYDGTTGNTSRQYCWVTKTNNAGASWTCAPVWTGTNAIIGDTTQYAISNLDAQSGTTCWLGAYKKIGTGQQGGIFKTTNSGASWTNMTAPGMFTNTTSFCNWVTFLTPNVGIADGDPNPSSSNEHEIWRSTDGGATWSMVTGANIPNPVSGEFGITNVYEKIGSSNIWFGTNKGRIYRSTDAGATWNVSTVNSGNTISDIAFYDANNGLVMTYVGTTTVSAVYNTNDGGATWNLLPNAATDPNYGRNDVCGIPGTSWYASCGAGTGNYLLSFSMDDGATWNSWGSTGIQYLAIDFVNPSTGWAGTFSDQTNAALFGMYKYNGSSLLQAPTANFNPPAAACVSVGLTFTNTSTGNPNPTYTWTCLPPANINSSSATNPTITFSNPGTYTVFLAASNSSSTSAVSRTISVGACTGLSYNGVVEFDFFVSPNPSKDVFNVILPYSTEAYKVTVNNVLGQTVYTDKANSSNGNYSINLANNKPGVYFLNIENGGAKTTKKIILE